MNAWEAWNIRMAGINLGMPKRLGLFRPPLGPVPGSRHQTAVVL
jgi:hypothetical protein